MILLRCVRNSEEFIGNLSGLIKVNDVVAVKSVVRTLSYPTVHIITKAGIPQEENLNRFKYIPSREHKQRGISDAKRS